MSIPRAKNLRKQMTEAEKKLWNLLRWRKLGNWKFRRQHPIGKYIADFVCVEANLIVEVDGGQHNENSYDGERTAWLQARGWRVVRFWNSEILENIDGVAQVLVTHLNSPSPSHSFGMGPSLSHQERASL